MHAQESKTVYLMGIGGIAMGTLATMLKEKGFEVAGSDQNIYPPMSTHLEQMGIKTYQGYDANNCREASPDVFIIGNVIRRENPEAQYVLGSGLPYLSMPEALKRFFLSEHESIVVAGTHGKSTISSLASWVLTHAGEDPTAFIGAFLKNWQRSYRLGRGRYMVLEGDEYDTAFFDKGAKFLHYKPKIGILTSIEFDHADIFSSFEAVFDAFVGFVRLIPPEGALIVNWDDPHCRKASTECRGKILPYGKSEEAHWRLRDVEYRPGEVAFQYTNPIANRLETMRSPLPGRHNVGNTLAVMAASSLAGLGMEAIQRALLAFEGVKRRQDVLGEANGVLVIDDFAHHPTAVRETIDAIRLFYPERRLIAAFEPRTNSSRRNVFQKDYASAFDGADLTCIKKPDGLAAIPVEERLDTELLALDLFERKKHALVFSTTDQLIEHLLRICRRGDLVLSMSNGSFDGFPSRLLSALNG